MFLAGASAVALVLMNVVRLIVDVGAAVARVSDVFIVVGSVVIRLAML